MKLVIVKTLVACCLMLCGIPIASGHLGIAFGTGTGVHHITPYRAAVNWEFGPIWRAEKLWQLNAIWETSIGVWDGPRRPDLAPGSVTDLTAFTTGPMFRWQRCQPFQTLKVAPFIELGVGLSWLSRREIEGRILSLHFQFEDKIGLGVRFGERQQFDLAVRTYHYSNCSIKRPNSGVNLFMINLGYWF